MTRRHSSKGPSQRQLRIGELIRHALADLFVHTDIADPDLAGAQITVTEVTVSPDIRHATVFVMPFGGGDRTLAAALARHHKFIRGELARRINLKFMPDLLFKLDLTFDESERIDALLRSPDVARDLH